MLDENGQTDPRFLAQYDEVRNSIGLAHSSP